MRSRIIAAILTIGLGIGILAPAPDDPGVGLIETATGVDVSAKATGAVWKCASWGCGEVVSYQPWLGKGTYQVDDKYVPAHWTTSQSNVDACTYLVVRRANTNQWYDAGSDCGGAVETISFDYWFAIDSVVIESKDNRGRWRYLTISGPTGQR